MTKRPDPPPSDTPRAGVRRRTAEPGGYGGYEVTDSNVEMAAPAIEEPPIMQGPSSSGSGASQVEFANPSAPQSELVEDTLSFEQHGELDRRIQKSVPWNEDDSEADRADMHHPIFKKIVRGYPVLDSKYIDEVESGMFLKSNPWLRSVLNKCWENGGFRIIRRLSESSLVINSACGNLCLIQRFYGLPHRSVPAGAPLVTEVSL